MKFYEIESRYDLSVFLNVPLRHLNYLLYVKGPNDCYRSFEIPKSNGGTRVICAPNPDLKSIQKKLASALYEYQQELRKANNIHSNISHGFEREKSCVTNAKIHKGKKYVLNVDLKDFFDCIHFGRVRGYFAKNKNFQLPIEVATVIAQLTCYQGRLPQGAPTSPIISNLICQILDFRLLNISKKYKLDYTRYADDLTFSTNDKRFCNKKSDFLEDIQREIERAGFFINEKKTRLSFKDSQQKVTGIVVNEKINIDQKYYKETRAMAHSFYTTGQFQIKNDFGTINQLEGRLSYINYITHNNSNLDTKERCKKPPRFEYLRHFTGKESEYRRFLFFRYFYLNKMPLVITEGKTDVVYIKSALKKLHKSYPNLIERLPNGDFNYKISFLHRSKRIQYYLGIVEHGADALVCLNSYFGICRNELYPDYFSYFSKLGDSPQMPVIVLFDNETKSERPLYKFLQNGGYSEEQKIQLQENLFIRAKENANLFLLTLPLPNSNSECEIENLFSEETLVHKINNKCFSLANKYDTGKFYGKDIFSKYISANYQTIEFGRFVPLLDKLNEIVCLYNLTQETQMGKG